MALFMVNRYTELGRINLIGIGIVDSNTYEYKIVPYDEVVRAIDKGVKIENLELTEQGDLVGCNGSLERYTAITPTGRVISKPSITILAEIVKDGKTIGFDVADYKGQVKRLRYADVLRLSKSYVIANGKVVETDEISYISPIKGEYIKLTPNQSKTAKIDKIKALYDEIGEFKNGFAELKQAGKKGLINSNYKVIVPPKYDKVRIVDYNFVKTSINGTGTGLYNINGKEILPPIYSHIRIEDPDILIVKNSQGLYGLVDMEGNEITPFIYSKIRGFWGDELSEAQIGKYYGYINKKGEEVIPIEYDKVGSFDNGLLAVLKNNKCGYVDMNGVVVVPIAFDGVKYFREGLAGARIGKLWGYINIEGKFVIKPQFEDCQDFSGGLAGVKVNGLWGFIDKTGKIVIRPIYREVSPFYSNTTEVKFLEHTIIIDKTGRKIRFW